MFWAIFSIARSALWHTSEVRTEELTDGFDVGCGHRRRAGCHTVVLAIEDLYIGTIEASFYSTVLALGLVVMIKDAVIFVVEQDRLSQERQGRTQYRTFLTVVEEPILVKAGGSFARKAQRRHVFGECAVELAGGISESQFTLSRDATAKT
jgi:hypothetical protein